MLNARFRTDLAHPTQQGSSGKNADLMKELEQAREETRQLRLRNTELRGQNILLQATVQENRRLRMKEGC